MIKKLLIIPGVLFSLLGMPVFASNFQVSEFSAAAMGTANAGTAVLADPSVQFFNPAAMPLIKAQSVSMTTTAVLPTIDFTPTAMTRGGVDQLATASHASPSHDAFIPMFYYVMPLENKRFHFGLSMTVPYGLQTEYEADSAARYFATFSSIRTLNLNPAGSYEWIPGKVSLGAGLNLQHLDADLNSMFAAGTQDVNVKNNGTAVGHGWNAGIFLKPLDRLRIGLSYRSRISHHVRGKTRVKASPAALAVAAALGIADGNAKINITLPETASLSMAYQVSPKWQMASDIQMTRWSRIQALNLIFGPQSRVKSILTKYYDTYRWALGATYQWDPRLALRAGYAHDQSPVSSRYRTARIPDNDRTWHSVGVGYAYSKQWQLDAAYSHVVVRNASIEERDPMLGHTLRAHYSGHANLYSAQIAYRFS